MKDTVLRENLVAMLRGGQAHHSPGKILEGIRPELRNKRPAEGVHTLWELLEHIRIAQEDIIRFTLDETWKSPQWPSGYWPDCSGEISGQLWQSSVDTFNRDLDDVVKLAKDQMVDLYGEIPHGEGRTYLRQILLVADHNSHHFGQILIVRKMLNNW